MLRRLAWILGGLIVVAIALVPIGLWLVDTPAVRAEIQGRLSAALGGQVAWESLELHVLPAPHGELRRVRLEIAGALSARAESVDVYLRLWPLLRGHAEIASVSVVRPEIRLAPSSGGEKDAAPLDPIAAYRQGIEPVARALQKFAPQTEVRIEAAAIDVEAARLQLSGLNVVARTSGETLELQVESASNYWKRLQVKGRVTYADLSARAELEVDELAIDRDLPAARLRATLHTDARTSIEADVDAALGTLLQEAKIKAVLPAGKPPEVTAHLSGVDLAAALALARRKVSGLEAIESAEGRASARVEVKLQQAWNAEVHVLKSDAALKLAQLPWKLSVVAGRAAISQTSVHVHGARGALGDSTFSDVATRIELGRQPRLTAATGHATLRLEQWFPWLRQRVAQLDQISALSGGLEVTLNRLALRFDRPADVVYEALATPHAVNVAMKALPGPVAVSGGSVRVDPARLRFDGVTVALLDSRTAVWGTLATKGPRIELSLAEGTAGEKLMQWALARGEVPAHLEPKTPLRFEAKRLAWAPGAPLEADAAITFDGGPALGLALAWQPGKLDLRRLAIKDARSDAVLGVSMGGNLVQASFAGTLYGSSLASMLRQPWGGLQTESSGVVRGKLLIKGDRKAPGRGLAEGRLRVEALDLTPFFHAKAMLESVDLSADGDTLRIAQAQLEWEEQRISLSGDIRRTAQGAVIDARLESPGIVIDRLLPPAPAAAPVAAPAAPEKDEQSMLAKLWQVPLPGRVEVNVGFVRYRHYEIAPLAGSMILDRERAVLDVKEARMCGVSLPIRGEATADSLALSAVITMKDQPLAQAGHCLTGEALDITGNADLRAELSTKGKPGELVRNLTGTAQGELRKGTVRKFALIGNILSVLSLRNLVSKEAGLQKGEFPYRSLSAKGKFENGEFIVEEGFFDSEAARLAASGKVDLLGANSQLTVLVGVFTAVDRVVDAVPLIGGVFGGTMAALPISVRGDIRDPEVVPLGPRAVTDRLLGIFERTLKLPSKLMVHPSAGEATPPPAR